MRAMAEKAEPAAPTAFEDLRRVGVIDVGSNSVRLVVFDGAARSPAYFFNEKVMCGLGRGLSETGRLNPEGRARAIRAMERFAALLESFEAQSVLTVATAAVRDAEDGPEFVEEVRARTGIRLTVASGPEEARLSAQGVLLGWPGAQGLVCDMGGASMELAELSVGRIGRCRTSPLGPLRLLDTPGGAKEAAQRIRAHVAQMREAFPESYRTLYLVGGSFRALAKLDMARRGYPLQVLHEYSFRPGHLEAFLKSVARAKRQALLSEGVSGERAPLLPMVSRVLLEVIATFGPKAVAVSSFGIREGLLYERMPPELRKRDPLIEAAAYLERTNARFPGFGERLGRWVRPFLPRGARWDRLAHAAGLLHDVAWRSHPSSRAEECFDIASRGNLAGLDHAGRAFLAIALLHRYRKSPRIRRYHALSRLLSKEEYRAAKVLGYGLRLGASLAGGEPRVLEETELVLDGGELVMRLPESRAALLGEAVESRLAMLAAAIGAKPRCELA